MTNYTAWHSFNGTIRVLKNVKICCERCRREFELTDYEKWRMNKMGQERFCGACKQVIEEAENRKYKVVLSRLEEKQKRKVCYSFDRTKILYQDKVESEYADPLPVLMAYGRVSNKGAWVGDVIGVTDKMPEGCELLKEIYLDW